MLRGVFVTGTGTGVGKTVVAAALLQRFGRAAALKYWKPIQTGIEQDDDTAIVRTLAGCGDGGVWDRGVRLRGLAAPYLAAERAGVTVCVRDLDRHVEHEAPNTRWIVEGAGGPLVPLNATEFMTDVMRHFGLPALVVTRSTLGTIHDTLAALEALRHRSIRVLGCVMVGEPDAENRKALERWGGVGVLGELPRLAPLSAATVGAWAISKLDPDDVLAPCFQP